MMTRSIALEARPRPATRFGRGWFARLAGWIVESDRRYRELQYLARMDDHLLQDIGITREDLARAIGQPERGRLTRSGR